MDTPLRNGWVNVPGGPGREVNRDRGCRAPATSGRRGPAAVQARTEAVPGLGVTPANSPFFAALQTAARAARLKKNRRKGIDGALGYLRNKAPYLRYDTALERGRPIATGIIEGACRHLVKDRLDIAGARWGLADAEAVLNSAPCAPTATSTPTGPGTRSKSSPATTRPATATNS
ncbi:hypothetical protein GCM10022206_09830 [Streptomyces chiangmaiensis]